MTGINASKIIQNLQFMHSLERLMLLSSREISEGKKERFIYLFDFVFLF